MPFDAILDHFANGFDDKLDPDQAQNHAMDLDQELQSKFLFFNIEEEVDSIEIEDRGEGAIHRLGAGSGPEECTAGHGDIPNWLWNHALNAMALARHLEKVRREKWLKAMPNHGWHVATTDGEALVIYVSADQRIFSVGHRKGQLNDRTRAWLEGRLDHWKFRPIGALVSEAGLAPYDPPAPTPEGD
jgi:hypothetical protein